MAEITSHRHKIPDFVAYPVKKSNLDEYLHSTRQEPIEVSFMFWSSDTGFERKVGGRRRRAKAGIREPGKTDVLWAHFSAREERWEIWIHPVKKTQLQPIKAALIPDGLVRLQEWLSEQAGYIDSNSRQPGSFSIAFDGKELTFTER